MVEIKEALKPKLIEQGYALQGAVVNKSIDLGPTNAHRIDLISLDLTLIIQCCEVISTMHCLTSLKIVVP